MRGDVFPAQNSRRGNGDASIASLRYLKFQIIVCLYFRLKRGVVFGWFSPYFLRANCPCLFALGLRSLQYGKKET